MASIQNISRCLVALFKNFIINAIWQQLVNCFPSLAIFAGKFMRKIPERTYFHGGNEVRIDLELSILSILAVVELKK